MPLFSVYLQHMYMCQILYFLWDPPPPNKNKKTELKRDREYLKNHWLRWIYMYESRIDIILLKI